MSHYKKLLRFVAMGASCYVILPQIKIQKKENFVYNHIIYAEEFQKKTSTIIDYENKLRLYSPPEKVFRYFASKKHFENPNEIYMKIDDFLNSYMLNKTTHKNYQLDIYENIDPKNYKSELDPNSAFKLISNNGLLNYYDFLVLMIILSTDESHLEIVFNTIDINNDGVVTRDEFLSALFAFLKKSVFGKICGKMELEEIYNNLKKLNIMKNLFSNQNSTTTSESKSIPINELIKFCKKIQMEIIKFEFDHFNPVNNKITDEMFAMLVISSSKIMINKRHEILHRIKQRFQSLPENERGVSFDQYNIFCKFLERIPLAAVALEFCKLNGDNIDKPIFKHIVNSLVNDNLNDHVVDVIFVVFDENGDQLLSNEEFTRVMKNRYQRGFKHAKETGISSLFEALYNCAKNSVYIK